MNPPLDRIDARILNALQKDARLSNKELAQAAGLAESSCLERVRRLRASGSLKGFHAEIEPQALGVELEAMISIRLLRHSRDHVRAFQDHLRSLPEVIASYHLAGVNDFLVQVAVRNSRHLRDLVLESFTARAEVAHVETALIFEHDARWVFPDYITGTQLARARRRKE